MTARAANILYIDDEPMVLRMMTLALENMGHEVLAVSDSRMAVDLFRVAPQDYDLVITDMSMPGLNGKRLVTHITAVRPDIPVILCSGSAEMTQQEVLDLGFRAFLEKPVRWSQVSETIRQVLLESPSILS